MDSIFQKFLLITEKLLKIPEIGYIEGKESLEIGLKTLKKYT